ncbi:MAG: peptidoglycan-binding protein [Methylocystis sp.]|uniref:peptidoglycan-binding domain-containing protein n=1 Tax=Methylocystis sp. TaxID=1911079 RepID=UPI003DA20931
MRDVSLSAQKFDDFPEERAAPKRRAPGPSPARAPKYGAPRNAPVKKRRLGAMALFSIAGLALVGVPLNALYFQDGRHPAPLFSSHVLVPEKPDPATTPIPPARPRIEAARSDVDGAKAEASAHVAPRAKDTVKADPLADILKSEQAPPVRTEKVERVEKPPVKVEKKREVASRDQIGSLLGAGAAKPAAPPAPATTATAPAAGPDRNVLLAQRALQRLGYVVKPDGMASPAMKKTIERFEKDNGLPVTGELSPKVAKALSARAAAQPQ